MLYIDMDPQQPDELTIVPDQPLDPVPVQEPASAATPVPATAAPDPANLVNWGDYIKAFAQIGTQLSETYSENNQETAQGFVQSLEAVEDMLQQLLTKEATGLSIPERDGLIELLKYLRKKLQRRAGAVGQNVVNM
jgi:hypothetical protein